MNKITTKELMDFGFNFKDKTLTYSGKPCIIDFYADWCQPCKPQQIVLDELSEKYSDIVFVKVNIEEEYELAEIFNIKNLPTVCVYGNENKRFSGFTQKVDIETTIKSKTQVKI